MLANGYKFYFLVLFSAGFSLSGLSHDRFMLPSHTVLSGEGTKEVSLIASVSNDMFHPDMAFGDNGKGNVKPSLKGFFSSLKSQIVTPDGKTLEDNIWQAFSRFSAGDVVMEKSGTYRVSLIQAPRLITFYKKADGSMGRIAGPDPKLPEGAKDAKTYLNSARVETYLTLNKPSKSALKISGVGLELGGESHPNDLFANEAARFQLFLDGKPLTKEVSVKAVRGGTRHRNQRELIETKTEKNGSFQITFPQAGFYMLKAEWDSPGKEGSGIEEESASLFVTLEVFPE